MNSRCPNNYNYSNLTHDCTLILLSENTLVEEIDDDNVDAFTMKPNNIGELYSIFENYGPEANIYIHNDLKILIAYATLRYVDEVIVYFPHAVNSKYVSIGEYYCAPNTYVIKYKAYIYLLNTLFNLNIQPGSINIQATYLENIIHSINPRTQYIEDDLSELIKYLNKYVFNYNSVDTIEPFKENITTGKLSSALQMVYSMGNKLL